MTLRVTLGELTGLVKPQTPQAEPLPDRYVVCACGKRPYPTKRAAKHVARVKNNLHEDQHRRAMGAYRCAISGEYHIGHRR